MDFLPENKLIRTTILCLAGVIENDFFVAFIKCINYISLKRCLLNENKKCEDFVSFSQHCETPR